MSDVVLPKLNQTGPNEFADVEDNDKAIRDVINGELDNNNLKAAAGIVASKLAGEIPGSKLANDILKLAVAGTERKVAFAESIVIHTNEATADLEVAHGLGTTPIVVIATTKNRDINAAVSSITATKMTIHIRGITGNILENESVFWVAIG